MFLRRLFISMVSFCLLYSATVFASDPTCSSSGEDLDYVTVADIKESLSTQPPMAVGFDVDETVLFSSPVFYHVALMQCEGVLIGCSQTPGYWDRVNTLDTFSLPKPIGVELVKMHWLDGKALAAAIHLIR